MSRGRTSIDVACCRTVEILLTALATLGVLAAMSFSASEGAKEPATQPAPSISIATYNINFRNLNLKEVVRAIRQADADLVCLQETTRQAERFVRRHLTGQYRYILFHHERWAGGCAFLSKVPLARLRFVPAKHGPFGTWFCQLTLDGRTLEVANVHLRATLSKPGDGVLDVMRKFVVTEVVRRKEIEYVKSKLTEGLPHVIAGDMNSFAKMPSCRYLTDNGFADSFAQVANDGERDETWHWVRKGVEWTCRFDYIFHTRSLATTHSRVLRTEGSDHYLLVSRLSWAPAKAVTAGQ